MDRTTESPVAATHQRRGGRHGPPLPVGSIARSSSGPVSEPVSRPVGASMSGSLGLLLAATGTGALAWTLARRGVSLRWAPAVRDDPAWWAAPGAVRVEDLMEVAAVALGTGVAGWFCLSLLVAAACAGVRSAGRAWVAGERWVGRAAPRMVRRALVLSAGTGVALTAVGLPAVGLAPPPDELGWTVTTEDDAAAGPTTDHGATPGDAAPAGDGVAGQDPTTGVRTEVVSAPSGGTSSGTAGAAGGTLEVSTPSSTGAVTVRPGDTLWAIARRHLPPGATTADVAAAWPAWYAANAGVVGADPDLIHPGQRLVPPAPGADAPADGTDR